MAETHLPVMSQVCESTGEFLGRHSGQFAAIGLLRKLCMRSLQYGDLLREMSQVYRYLFQELVTFNGTLYQFLVSVKVEYDKSIRIV